MSLNSTYKSLFVFLFVANTFTNVLAQVPTLTFEYLDSITGGKMITNKKIPTDSSTNQPINLSTIKQYNNSTILQYPYNKKRIRGVVVANVVGYGAIMYGLSAAWYKGYPKSKMHSFDDNGEWLQIDKIGHALGAYAESNASTEVWRWTGIARKKRILLGGLSGAAYQTIIEVLDGYNAEWGWSWGDFGANIFCFGIFVYVLQTFLKNSVQMHFGCTCNIYPIDILVYI